MAQLVTGFERQSAPELVVTGARIINALDGNPIYRQPWPAPFPGLEQIKLAQQNFEVSCAACVNNDSARIAQRDADRKILTDMLKSLAPYLEAVANGDHAALVSSGYELRHETVRSSTPPEAPTGVYVSYDPHNGNPIVHADPCDGHVVEVFIAQGDAPVEASWHHHLTVTTARRIPIEGLIPLAQYWLRLRAINHHGPGQWSEIVSIITRQ